MSSCPLSRPIWDARMTTTMPVAFAVGDHVQYVGGGRFHGRQVFENHFELRVGQVGFVHCMPGAYGDLGCTFRGRGDERPCKISLNKADVRRVVAEAPAARIGTASIRLQALPRRSGLQRLPTLPSPAVPLNAGRGGSLSRTLSAPLSVAPGPKAGKRGGPLASAGAKAITDASRTFGQVVQTFDTFPPMRKTPSDDASSVGSLPPLSMPTSRSMSKEKDDGSPEPSSDRDRPHPPSFYCPISRQCMHDPVVLTDGHTYERRYIEQWLESNSTSPVSGALLPSKTILPNHALRNAIEEYFEQVLSDHRQAVRQVTAGLMQRRRNFSCSTTLLRTVDSMMQCAVLVNADLSAEMVLRRIMEEAKALVGAEVASVFLLDSKRHELYSTVNSTNTELRIPLNSGVAGYVASTGMPLIIPNAYEDKRFNTEVDVKTGFKTCNILCVPIKVKGGNIGVAQLINKTCGGVLTSDEEQPDPRLGFTADDLKFFEILATQAAAALAQQGGLILERVPSKRDPSVQSVRASPSTPVRRMGTPPPVLQASPSASCSSTTFEMLPPVKEGSSVGKGLERACEAEICKEIAELNPAARCALTPLLDVAWDSWEADTLTLAELTLNRPLATLTEYLIRRHGLIETFSLDVPKLERFLAAIEAGYPHKNQYHNRSHAASVLHFAHALLFHGGMAEAAAAVAAEVVKDDSRRRSLVILAGLLAAAVHDFEHEGVSNDFLVKTLDQRTITYNDKSPNEQHHVAAAFGLLMRPDLNFMALMSNSEFLLVRRVMLDMVLATDMAEGNKILQAFNDMTSKCVADMAAGDGASAFCSTSASEASLVLKMAIKCADLGHLALPWASHLRWVHRLEHEFFEQGDKEKQLGLATVSFLMDRNKPGVTETQKGFFDFAVLPLYRSLGSVFPGTRSMVAAVEANYHRWCNVQAELKASA